MAKQKAKKRHIANSDTDSENSYPVSQPTNSSSSSSSTSTKKPYVPRFFIIHSEKEGETISSLSPSPEFAYRLAVVRGLNSHGGLYF